MRELINEQFVRQIRQLRYRAILINTLSLLLIFIGINILLTLLAIGLFLSGWILLFSLIPLGILSFLWLKRTGLKNIGYRIEHTFPGLKGKVVSALDLINYQPDRRGYSLELRDAAIQQVQEMIRPLPLKLILPFRRLLISGVFSLLALVLLVLTLNQGGERVKFGLLNAFKPDHLPIYLKVVPGDTTLLAGETAKLVCSVQPAGVFKSIQLQTTAIPNSPRIKKIPLRLSADSCIFTLTTGETFYYRFRLLNKKTDWYRVNIIAPLALKSIAFNCTPPAYTGMKPIRQSGGDLALLKGTKVNLTAQVTGTAENGFLILPAETLPLALSRDQPGELSGGFTIRQDGEARIELATLPNRQQTVYRFNIRAIPDESPLVKVFLPGRDVNLPMNMQVPLGINSIDDFGITEIWLHYGKDSINNSRRLKTVNNHREDTTFYLWDLSKTNLLPGEAVRYFVRVVDNDAISGPKSTRSEIYTVRFPSMEQIYAQAVNQTTTTQEQLAPLQNEQAELGSALARISEELKKQRELSWEERKKLEQIVNEQINLLNQIDRLQNEVAQTTAELLQGMSWDQETLERLSQLQELLSRLLPQELQKALNELGSKLTARPDELKALLERLQEQQSALKADIDRALELLKRIMDEIQLEALARQAEKLAQKQNELTGNIPTANESQLIQQQEEIKTNLDSLLNGIEQLARQCTEPALTESLAALNQEMAIRELPKQADALKQLFNSGDKLSAQLPSRELAGSIRQLADRLRCLSEQLKKNRAREVMKQLLANADQLLTISQYQEKLEEKMTTSDRLVEIANEQSALGEATKMAAESLASLSTRTLAIPPPLHQELGNALNLMSSAAKMAMEGSGSGTKENMRQARQRLNRAAGMLIGAAAKMEGGGLSGGLQNLLDQLAKMASEQMSINAGTASLPIPIPSTGLTSQQLAQLSRLLSQQQALRQQLEQLLQQMGGERPGLTGALDRMLEEMRQVERGLAELQIDRKLIERQEDIVARLLDAQRSLRQQGFKEERQAETARPYRLENPPELPEDQGERNRLLRSELLRALQQQRYPVEYEKLIRAYFELLLNK